MAAVGALLLIFIIMIRPQEFVPGLESLRILDVATLLSIIGIAIEIGTGKVRSLRTPQLPFLAVFAGWCVLSTAIGAGIHAAIDIRITLPILFMLIVIYGINTFERFRAAAILLVAIAVTLCVVGAEQAASPFECIVLVDGNHSIGESNGMSCENYHDCIKATNDYKNDYACEKVGMFKTFTVAHGRVRWRGILEDPNEMSLAIGAALAFAFALHASMKGFFRHLLLLATLVLATYCVMVSASRGGQLVLVTVIGTYFVRAYGRKGFILGLILGAPIVLLGGRDTEEAQSSALERIGALYEGISFVKSHPIFGLGCGEFIENYFITAHNTYLLTASELGFPGMLAWTAFMYVSIKIPLTIATRPPPDLDRRLIPYALALVTSFAGIAIGIFFLSFCYHPMLFIYLGLSSSLFIIAKRSSPSFDVRVSGKEIGLLAAFDAALLTALFVYTRAHGPP